MSKKIFNIIDYISEKEIIDKINEIGKNPLTITGHGFNDFGPIPIIKSANKSTLIYSNKSKLKPAIALIDVVLAANRNYNKVVEPNIQRIEKDYQNLKRFTELEKLITQKSKQEFYIFWGHKDEKKYNTLKNLLNAINSLRKGNPSLSDDFELMNLWAKKADLTNYKKDIIGSLPNIAIATFQHLRMVFGVDTIKPDQRVKEVLDFEFGLTNLSDVNTIKAVEQISKITSFKVITIDQIFVQYGSSYYNQLSNKISIKEIISNLKKLGVSSDLISKATNLTTSQISKIK
jgi:hypothetical protein